MADKNVLVTIELRTPDKIAEVKRWFGTNECARMPGSEILQVTVQKTGNKRAGERVIRKLAKRVKVK